MPIIAELPGHLDWEEDSMNEYISMADELFDGVLVPDIPTGRIRPDSLLTLQRIRNSARVEVIAGLSARHRSVEASISRVLAFWKLGIRHVYVVMGDPTPTSDGRSYTFARATSLIKMIKDMKRGEVTFNGIKYRPHVKPNFLVGSALLPARQNEVDLLKRKLEAGADFLITQAMFEADSLRSFIKKCEASGLKLDLPVFISLPLIAKATSLRKLASLQGVVLPKEIMRALLQSEDIEKKSIDVALQTFSSCMELGLNKLGAYILPLPGSTLQRELVQRLRKSR